MTSKPTDDFDFGASGSCVTGWIDRLVLIVVAAVLLLTAGCGGSDGPVRMPVSGTVTLDEAPLSSGVIRFIPTGKDAGPGAMCSIVDGKFQFSDENGPVVQQHRVEIEATGYQGFEIDDESAFAAQVQKTGRSPVARNPVPAIYNSASTLTATVTDAADQTFQFPLQTRKAR